MRVFVTGATGWVGSATVRELLGAGHQVVGLARSDASAAALTSSGAEVRRGSLDDVDGLHEAAAAADGVVHTAFKHDFSDFVASARADLDAVTAMGEALAGSGRPFVIASGTGIRASGPATEDTPQLREGVAAARLASEDKLWELAERGVRTSVVRLPPSVHGEGEKGSVPMLIGVAREKGVSAYVGDGANRWPAVHRLDAAHLFRLAVENARPGTALHAVGDEAVPARDIAAVIGRHLEVPVTSVPADQAMDHFGFLGAMFSLDMPASSELTRKWLNWYPTHAGLLDDLEAGHYFAGAR